MTAKTRKHLNNLCIFSCFSAEFGLALLCACTGSMLIYAAASIMGLMIPTFLQFK